MFMLLDLRRGYTLPHVTLFFTQPLFSRKFSRKFSEGSSFPFLGNPRKEFPGEFPLFCFFSIFLFPLLPSLSSFSLCTL